MHIVRFIIFFLFLIDFLYKKRYSRISYKSMREVTPPGITFLFLLYDILYHMMTAASYCVMSDRYAKMYKQKIITEDTHVIAYVIMLFIWRENMNKSFIKKYGTLLLLAAGPELSSSFLYIRETFYVPIQNAMNRQTLRWVCYHPDMQQWQLSLTLSVVLLQINSLHVSCLHFHSLQPVSSDYGSQPSRDITSAA